MDIKQILKYKYCEKHMKYIEDNKIKMPFKRQMYGCGRNDNRITFALEERNQEMYDEIFKAIKKAEDSVTLIISGI